jgi:hypothetical protein
MNLSLRAHIRGLLRIQQARRSPTLGPKPAIGDLIGLGDLRMTVQAGFSNELWLWLVEQGWRELRHRPERRHYREIPVSCVTELIDALPEERARLLQAAIRRAQPRPIVGDPAALPSYVTRH